MTNVTFYSCLFTFFEVFIFENISKFKPSEIILTELKLPSDGTHPFIAQRNAIDGSVLHNIRFIIC